MTASPACEPCPSPTSRCNPGRRAASAGRRSPGRISSRGRTAARASRSHRSASRSSTRRQATATRSTSPSSASPRAASSPLDTKPRTPSRANPGLVLSDEFRRAGVEVGDELTIVGPDTTLPVLGFTYAGSYGHVDIAFSSLDTWQRLVYGDNAKGRFSAIAIQADDDTLTRRRSTGRPRTDTETKEAGLRRLARLRRRDRHHGPHPGLPARDLGAHRRRVLHGVDDPAHPPDRPAQGARRLQRLRAARRARPARHRAASARPRSERRSPSASAASSAPACRSASRRPPVVASAVALVVLGMAGSLVAVRKITSVDPIIALGAES